MNNQNLIDLSSRTEEDRKKIAAMGGKAKALKLKQEKAFTEYANKRFYEEEGYKAVFDALYDRVIACADPKSVMEKAITLTNELLSGHVYEPTRKVAELWLNKKATDEEYIASLKEAVCSIDEVIELFSSQTGINMFGKEKAESIAKHAKEVKDAGVNIVIVQHALKH